jgi:hypothetical protein
MPIAVAAFENELAVATATNSSIPSHLDMIAPYMELYVAKIAYYRIRGSMIKRGITSGDAP